MQISEKLTTLRTLCAQHALAGYVQPVHDEFLSEYPPACFQRVSWLSGFTGSAGTLVVLADKAALFVDGRYVLQAAQQVDAAVFSVINSGDVTPEQWIAREAPGMKIGYDPTLFTSVMRERFVVGCEMVAVPNLVDAIWSDRPPLPATAIFLHDDKLAGESSQDKCARLAKIVAAKGADAAFVSAPESVCWLLNIRARDVECTPLALVRAILYADGTVELLVDPARLPALGLGSHVRAVYPSSFARIGGKKIICDMGQTPCLLLDALLQAGANILKGEDPCALSKACKSPVQIAGIRAAHLRDGRAVAKLLCWLDAHPAIETVSEMEVADRLLAFRAEDNNFVEPSFPTIAGAGEHGAIVHYRADAASNRRLVKGELLLLDSGGQYPDGTTDITRTVAIGTPSAEHRDRFTRVLKGHIALATAIFPRGTRGSQLDALARQFLWQVGLDYDHGTGHGVGQFLGVHEGPQRISKRGGDVPLEVGMIISNEPGYYQTGDYGIRIENLVVVVEKSPGFLGFETITCAPLDVKLIDFSMLTEAEKSWLDSYQGWVNASLVS